MNGRPFRFTVETGAGFFGISPRAAKALGLRVDSIEIMSGSRSPVARIDSLNVGGATLHGLTARLMPLFDNTDFDGIVSPSILRELLTTIDFGASRLLLERGALPAPNDRDIFAIPGRDRAGRIDMPFEMEGFSGAAVLDSRSFIWIIANDSVAGAMRLEAPPRAYGNAWGPSMGTFQLSGARATGDLRFGQFGVKKPAITFRNRSGLVVGVPFMEQFVITIDQKNKRIRFARTDGSQFATVPQQEWERNATSAVANAAERSQDGARRVVNAGAAPVSGQRTMGFGIAGAPGSNRLTIMNVVAGSGAAIAGVRDGDLLLELDGTPASAMNPGVVRAAVARGSKVKVVVSRDGKQLEFDVEPYRVP
jgi:hypothetical protein